MWGDNGSGEDLMGSLDGMRLIGRDRESARLYDAMTSAAQGQPQVVLVVGDAGIGKTSLVTAATLRATELGFTTAVGHCLDIEAAMSFAPVIEAVRALSAGDSDRDDRPHARRMRGLLDPDAPEHDRVRMLDDLRLTILEAAAYRPLLLILEDLHWADRSTQELVSALARTARGRLLLMLTVRGDELHRRHPFRAAFAELSRIDVAQRIDLGPLDRDEVAALVHERSGVEGRADKVTSVHERSEGNPLYAEELIDADAVPEHLSDLLLARVTKLSSESRSLVRAASVDGSRLDTELLETVTGLEPDLLEHLLREAIDDNVLRQRGSALEFRHGLLREAVYDDLLPGERTRTHAAFAEALQERVDRANEAPLSQLSRLAFHWSQAHDPSRTLAASVRAGLAALHVGAAESVTHLDRAVALWDRVPDPEERTGRAKPDLLLLLGQAHLDNERRDLFEALTREAVAELAPDTDRLVTSRVYATFAHCPPTGEDRLSEEEAIRLALEYAGATPSPELSRAIGSQSSYHHRRGNGTRALEAAEQAVRVARHAQDAEREVEALHFTAIELELLGRLADAVTCAEEAVRTARNAGRLGHALFETSNLAWFQLIGGSRVQAYETGVAGLEGSLANALPTLAVFCGGQAFACLVWQGRFDDAGRLAKRLNDLDVDTHDDWRDGLQQELGLARGDPSAIAKSVEGAPRFVRSGFHHGGDEIEVDQRVTGLLMLERPADARALAESYLSFVECGDSPVRHASAAYTAYRAASAPLPKPRDDLSAHAGEALAWARSRLTDQWRTSVHGLRFCMAEGYLARFGGTSAVDVLREAVAIGQGLGAFVELEPRLLLAEELLGHGERDEGRERLVAVWADARAMGAGDLERRAFRLATRARVPLPHDAESPGTLTRLTPREREVLDLLADGATNRAISEALFIAEKTASVHVSNVLAKLGVANRGEAAALARRHL